MSMPAAAAITFARWRGLGIRITFPEWKVHWLGTAAGTSLLLSKAGSSLGVFSGLPPLKFSCLWNLVFSFLTLKLLTGNACSSFRDPCGSFHHIFACHLPYSPANYKWLGDGL